MGRPPKHRDAILAAAIKRFRDRGYAATGIAEILELSGAPRGSLYHFFPDGKEELGAAAIRRAGAVVTATLEDIAAKSADGTAFLEGYFGLLMQWLRGSGYRGGCPVATTLLETAGHSTLLREAGAEVFGAWESLIAAQLGGRRDLASMTISAVEGALLQAQLQLSVNPLEVALASMLRLCED